MVSAQGLKLIFQREDTNTSIIYKELSFQLF